MNDTINRFSPLSLQRGRRLVNRVVVPPMASETADEQGFATAKTLAHYARLARAGTGLVMVEYTFVHASGRSEPHQLGISSDGHVPGLARIARIIHEAGAVAGLQITHSGAKSSREMTGGPLMAPSAIAVPVRGREMEVPDAMGSAEIALWKDSFAAALRRAVVAGFDLVEFHAAHGYGLNQWLSPITNRRDDAYGLTLQGRSRLLFEVIEQARAAHPQLLLAVRMPGQDFFEGGLSTEDARWIARELESRGLDIIDVSSGIGGWRRMRERSGEGYLVAEAAAIQEVISLPVIGVGGIESGSFIDETLARGRLSLAAVGRALLKDPEDWGRRHLRRAGRDARCALNVRAAFSSACESLQR